MGTRRLLAATLVVIAACGGGSERPAVSDWAQGATPVIDAMQSSLDELTGIFDLIPGDYIPRRMLRTCFVMADAESAWTSVLVPGPTPAIDDEVAAVMDGIQALCLDLHDADLVDARPLLLELQAGVQELRLASSGDPDR